MAAIELNDFLVFEVDESGERKQVEDITPQTLQSILHAKQVLVILRWDLRRIFIWKGSASPVKKRFISARIATELREEVKGSAKIVSVDQGDEVEDFLDAFGLESMPVTEVLDDMRYIRNSEKMGSVSPEAMVLKSKIKKIQQRMPIPPLKTKIVKGSPKIDLSEDGKESIIKILNTINQQIQRIIEILKKS
ncbi:MAG: hypothetical protein ACTSQU_06710 [Promethearchaeota archaeon]